MPAAAGVDARERQRERAAAVGADAAGDAAAARRRDRHADALARAKAAAAATERIASDRHQQRAAGGRVVRGRRGVAARPGDRDRDAEGEEDGGHGKGGGERHGLLMVPRQRGPGSTTCSTQLTTLTTIAPRIPAPSVSISKSGTSQSVTKSITTFTTNRNSPSVRMISGSDSSRTTGRSHMLTSVKTAAARMSVHQLSPDVMFVSSHAATKSAIAFAPQRTRNRMSIREPPPA